MLKRGNADEVTAASVVLSYVARGGGGKELVLSNGLVDPLLSALSSGDKSEQSTHL